MILEMHSFLGNLAGLGEGPDLKTTGVRKNRAIPVGEMVKSSEVPDDVVPRPEPQVIGIAEDNL